MGSDTSSSRHCDDKISGRRFVLRVRVSLHPGFTGAVTQVIEADKGARCWPPEPRSTIARGIALLACGPIIGVSTPISAQVDTGPGNAGRSDDFQRLSR